MKWLKDLISGWLAKNPPPKPQYPQSVAEVVNDDIVYRKATVEALERFKEKNPFRGTTEEIEEKFRSLHRELCDIYDVAPGLEFHPTVPSCFLPFLNLIVIKRNHKRYSVVAYLHEFRHALGTFDEYKACAWSINLFRKVFPEQYRKLVPVGHMLVKTEHAEQYRELMGIK